MKKLFCFLLSSLLIINTLFITAFADNSFIIVDDGFLSQDTMRNLVSKAESIYSVYSFSAYFIMTNEVTEKGPYNVATEFYDKNVKENGVVFWLDSASGKAYVCGGDDFSEDDRNAFLFAYTADGAMTYGERIEGYLNKALQRAKELASQSVSEESERLMPRFMDNAGVIEDNKEEAIYSDIDAFSEKNLIDVVFVTYGSDEAPGAYADKYYEEYNFGFGQKKKGVILALNTKSSNLSIAMKGGADKLFEKNTAEKLGEELSLFTDDAINLFINYLEGLDKRLIRDIDASASEADTTQSSDFPPLPGNIGENGEIMPRIYDGAKIISDSRESEIQLILDEISRETGLDFVVATVFNVPEGFTASAYAEKYFEHFSFDSTGTKDGVMLMIAFEPECCFLTAFGKAKLYFSDSDLRDYTESFYSQYKKQSYDEAVHTFASQAAQRLLKEKLELPVIAACVLTVCAAGVIIAIVVSKKKQKQQSTENEFEYQ